MSDEQREQYMTEDELRRELIFILGSNRCGGKKIYEGEMSYDQAKLIADWIIDSVHARLHSTFFEMLGFDSLSAITEEAFLEGYHKGVASMTPPEESGKFHPLAETFTMAALGNSKAYKLSKRLHDLSEQIKSGHPKPVPNPYFYE